MAGTIGEWRMGKLLDPHTRHTALLYETRSVDDQVAWLDDETVLHAISEIRRPGELSRGYLERAVGWSGADTRFPA